MSADIGNGRGGWVDAKRSTIIVNRRQLGQPHINATVITVYSLYLFSVMNLSKKNQI